MDRKIKRKMQQRKDAEARKAEREAKIVRARPDPPRPAARPRGRRANRRGHDVRIRMRRLAKTTKRKYGSVVLGRRAQLPCHGDHASLDSVAVISLTCRCDRVEKARDLTVWFLAQARKRALAGAPTRDNLGAATSSSDEETQVCRAAQAHITLAWVLRPCDTITSLSLR